MAAMAVDQNAAQSHGAHLAEGDFHRPAVGVRRRVAFLAWHAAIEARRGLESNCRLLVVRRVREPLSVVGVSFRAIHFRTFLAVSVE